MRKIAAETDFSESHTWKRLRSLHEAGKIERRRSPTAFTPEPVRRRVAGMKPLIAHAIVEKAVREELEIPTGELNKADLAKVTGLSLSRTNLPDVGLKDLAKLQNLTELNLRATNITDAGLKEVAKLQNLTELDLTFTKITDAVWPNHAWRKEVGKLQKLKRLSLYGSQITAKTAAWLRKALPKCKIPHSYNPN